jgi:hypothetical protein
MSNITFTMSQVNEFKKNVRFKSVPCTDIIEYNESEKENIGGVGITNNNKWYLCVQRRNV